MDVDDAATQFLKALREQASDPGEVSSGAVAAAVAAAFPDSVPLLEGEYEEAGRRYAGNLQEKIEKAKEDGRKAAAEESPDPEPHPYLEDGGEPAAGGHSYL